MIQKTRGGTLKFVFFSFGKLFIYDIQTFSLVERCNVFQTLLVSIWHFALIEKIHEIGIRIRLNIYVGISHLTDSDKLFRITTFFFRTRTIQRFPKIWMIKFFPGQHFFLKIIDIHISRGAKANIQFMISIKTKKIIIFIWINTSIVMF